MLKRFGVIWLAALCALALSAVTHAELYLFRLAVNAKGVPPHVPDTEPISLFLVIVLGPVLEELLFRYGLIGMLLRRRPSMVSVPLSAVIFAACHVQYASTDLAALSAMSTILTCGLAYGCIYVRSGTVWAPILSHSAYNALSFMPVEFLYELEQYPGVVVLTMSLVVAAIGAWCIHLACRQFSRERAFGHHANHA